jgi:hypothetical protein
MTDEEEASYIKGAVSSHNVYGLADKIYLAHVLEAIGVETDE